MGIRDWFRKKKEVDAVPAMPTVPQDSASIDAASPFYRARTTSEMNPVFFATATDASKYIKANSRFTEYMIRGIQYVHVDRKYSGYVYEVYRCDSEALARQFLERIPMHEIPPKYYVVVETPACSVGKDLNGIFVEGE